MNINKKIDLNLTQISGQTSQPEWFKTENNQYWEMLNIKNKPILIKLSQNNINSLNIEYELSLQETNVKIKQKDIENKISEIFNLNFNLDKFYMDLKDFDLEESVKFCNGLRLFQAKDPFECIISSICSANNSIKRWVNSINTIKYKFGEKVEFESGTFHTFPKPETLSKIYLDAEEEENKTDKHIDEYNNNLKSCGVGYRNKYMQKASLIFENQLDINEIKNMEYSDAFDTIIKIPGVGPKVADCILLYGFGFMEAFPSDVWIKRIISYLYFNQKEISAEKARNYGMEKFGEYAGYVQLYLFHYARKSGLMDKIKK